MQHPAWATADDIITALREGRPGVMESLYDGFRLEFLSWAGRRFKTAEGDLDDAWQDAVLIFYEKVLSGQFTSLNCHIRTYLFAVGYKRLLKNHRKMKRFYWKDEVDEILRAGRVQIAADDDDIWQEERQLLLSAIETLKPRCRELLVRRYYHEGQLEDLMLEFEYASTNSVSVSLFNCLAALRKIIEKKITP